jgi:hypothetical protein
MPTTSYERKLLVKRIVDGLPVSLALQRRIKPGDEEPLWVLSWRTRYSPNKPNRRLYYAKADCWTIPAAVALEMIEEMGDRGGLDQKYFDHRRPPRFDTLVSTTMTSAEKQKLWRD